MNLTELYKMIKEMCKGCKECRTNCTGNIILKCIERERFVVK